MRQGPGAFRYEIVRMAAVKMRKAVILAGGYGTRLMEETGTRPKPMVEIGGKPILWHIMKIYAAHGVTEFVVPLGYKGHMIKQYFFEYHLHASDVTIDLATNALTLHKHASEPWAVTLVDTGLDTMTGAASPACESISGTSRST